MNKTKKTKVGVEFWDNPYIEKFDFEQAYNDMIKRFEKRFKNEQAQ